MDGPLASWTILTRNLTYLGGCELEQGIQDHLWTVRAEIAGAAADRPWFASTRNPEKRPT